MLEAQKNFKDVNPFSQWDQADMNAISNSSSSATTND